MITYVSNGKKNEEDKSYLKFNAHKYTIIYIYK